MTEWYRPGRQSSKEAPNPWIIEGNLYDDFEHPRNMPKISQGMGEFGLRGFSGLARQEHSEIKVRGVFRGTEAEMRQRGLTDEQLAYQNGTPRSPLRNYPDRSKRPPRAAVDDEDFSQHTYMR